MILDHIRTSDMDMVLDLSYLLNVEVRDDKLRSCDTKCNEIIIAMRKRPDEEILENLRLFEK